MALSLAACGAADSGGSASPATETPAPAAEASGITSKEMTFYLGELEDARTQTVYFVGDSDVTYVSLEDWGELYTYFMRALHPGEEISFALTYSSEGETATLTLEDGYTMVVDCAADTITFYDYDAFIRPDESRVLIDILSAGDPGETGDVQLFRRANGSYERYGDMVVLDAGAYGIDFVSDGEACYLPLQTLSDFLLSLHYVNPFYNGEAVYFVANGALGNQFGQELTELGKALYSVGEREISEAMGAFNYAEVRLVFDNLYGLKDAHGIKSFEDLALQTGFREALMRANPNVADEALWRILWVHLDDKHSGFTKGSPWSREELFMELAQGVGYGRSSLTSLQQDALYQTTRAEAYPDGVPAYEEVGNTAYITFDGFTPLPEDADYYETAPTADAQDTIGIMLYAYSQITRKDSPVENVVLDLSCNGGAAADAAIFVISSFLGEGYASLTNTMSGAPAIGRYNVDVNLDKQFDENDMGLTGKKLFCLISPNSFSCGNLAPSVFKNSNMVTLIGRASGGGSCAVLPMSAVYGTCFQISGPERLAFTQNDSFYDIDRGAEPDFFLAYPESFYDRASLTEYINTLR